MRNNDNDALERSTVVFWAAVYYIVYVIGCLLLTMGIWLPLVLNSN